MASNNRTTSSSGPVSTICVSAEEIAGCRDNNRDAQQRLFEICQGQVFRLMVRMVGIQDASDLTQEVFLHVFRKIDQYAGHSKFETWLYRVASNEALQYLRKQKRRNVQPLTHEPMSQEKPDRMRDEHKEILDVALSRVDPELRSIFVLREIEKLSYREIAEAIDIPEGTVGSRLNRARRELQKHLTDLGWES